MKKMISLCTALVLLAVSLCSCAPAEPVSARAGATEGVVTSAGTVARLSVHDPSITKSKSGEYYVFGSHIAVGKSSDLLNWSEVYNGVGDDNRILVPEGSTLREVLAEPLAWTDAYQTVQDYDEENWETNVWAPDVIYNEAMGKYCYYACSSVWGTTASVIWMATSDNIEGPYEYAGALTYSGFNKKTKPLTDNAKDACHYSYTNLGALIENGTFTKEEVEAQPWFDDNGSYDCTYGMYPNCIDPTVFYDAEGNLWMTYGSFSGGIYILPLVEETGMPDYAAMRASDGYDIYFGKQLTKTNEETAGTGEGPFIFYDGEYYYLLLSYGGLAALGGYNIRLYRSETPDGDYTDVAGSSALEMKNTGLKLFGNYQLPGSKYACLSGGHCSALVDDDGKVYLVYHTRFNDGEGNFHCVQVHQMYKTADGWYTVLPRAYSGETVSENGYSRTDIAGTYALVQHGSITVKCADENDWSRVQDIIAPTITITLNDDGTVTGYSPAAFEANRIMIQEIAVLSATWQVQRGTPYITLDFGGTKYTGVLCMQPSAGSETSDMAMAISAKADDNSTIWAVRTG